MDYSNLTDNQKDLTRWFVQQVRSGNLSEEFTVLWLSHNRADIIDFDGSPPTITKGMLDALAATDLLLCTSNYRTVTSTIGTTRPKLKSHQEETSRRCTLTGKAYEVVDSDFAAPPAHNRMPLGRLAEKAARWLYENDPLGKSVPDNQIIQGLDIDQAQYERAMRELLDLDLVESASRRSHGDSIVPSPRLTKDGRLAVKRGFMKSDTQAVTQHIGAQFNINAPVSQSPMAAIVDSQDITVNQFIEGADPVQLAEAGATYLDQILDLTKNDLQGSQLVAYAKAIEDLKEALAEEHPDNSKLQRLLSTVAFLDNANGAIELGAKGWMLAEKVVPPVLVLIKVIGRIASLLV
jgi:hypothetical protein